MTRFQVLLCASAACVALPALAAQQPSQSSDNAGPPNQNAHQIAQLLVPEESWNKMLDQYASTLSTRIEGALNADGKQPPKDLQGKIRSDLGGTLSYSRATQLEAQALTKKFSSQELGTIASFYQSPTGQKALRELPAASREVSDELETRLTEQVPQILQRYAPSLAKKTPSSPSPTPGGSAPPVAK